MKTRAALALDVFPARAGMSLAALPRAIMSCRVPRASGDEPRKITASKVASVCSPRERG